MDKIYKGVDVSAHNGVIDWAKTSEHIDFAFIRCGYGQNGADKRFEDNVKGCIDYGIPFGIYIFSYALTVNDAIKEANRAVEFAKKYKPPLGIAYDFEDDSIRYMTENGKSADPAIIKSMANAFLKIVDDTQEFMPVLYTNKNFYNKYYHDIECALWLAQWQVSQPSVKCDFWQASSSGIVPGIWGYVDINYTDYLPDHAYPINGVKSFDNIYKIYNDKYYKIALQVINGKYDNGEDRKAKIKAKGYDYSFVQSIVNCILRNK